MHILQSYFIINRIIKYFELIIKPTASAMHILKVNNLKPMALWALFIAATTQYESSTDINCTAIHDVPGTKFKQNLEGLWDILTLPNVDMMCYLVVCPIIFFVQVMIIVTYIKQRQLRAKPGNIFCAILSIQTGLNVHLFSNALFHIIWPSSSQMPNCFVGFCMTMAIFGTVFTIIHFMYLVMFMFYTIFVFRFSLKKKSELFWNTLHVIVILISLIITLFFFLINMMGLNFYGLCALTDVRNGNDNIGMPIFQLIASFAFGMLGIYTYCYFRKHMPASENFRRRKQQESKIILMYVTGFSLFLAFQSIAGILIELNCQLGSQIIGIAILLQIVNILRLVEFVFLIFLILFNEKFRYKFQLILKSIFRKKDQFLVSKTSSMLTQFTEASDVIFNQRLLERKQKANEIDLLLLSQVYTIISGIYIAYYEYFRDINSKQNIKGIHYRQCIMFFLNNRSVLFYERDARSMIKLKILSCNILIHCPKVFSRLLALQGINNVYESFHIVENSKKLSNLAEGKGGRSGEFFFFSSDNKYVLKTVTREQFKFYSDNLQAFYDYYVSNPKSLLAKILGLFTIKGDEIQRTYYLILMKNILSCEKSQIIRIYDLKGSKYDRQVLFQQTQINQISKMTLKDIDFINLESKIKIKSQKSKDLAEALKKDSIFLRNLNLLDYSLLVVRVKWKQSPVNESFWGELQRIAHETEADEFYHIGVIDYLQKWDFNKKSEKWWKKFLGKKDFSAQEPRQYQKRFMKFISQIVANILEQEREELIEQSDISQHQRTIELQRVNTMSQEPKEDSNERRSISIDRPREQTQKVT